MNLIRDLQLLDGAGELLQLDSMAIVDLSLELEDAMKIVIPPTSLIPENFECIDALVTLVEQLRLEGE